MVNKVNRNIRYNRIILFLCIAIYILYTILYYVTDDNISSMILLGADYKTFTLGLGEYFRLLTSGFCHFSFIHLFANMISLLSLGTFIENIYGSKKYLLFLLCSILIGSLTSGALNSNIIESGISSALYAFLVIVFLYFYMYHNAISFNFISIVFLNIGLNFMPGVAWQAHLGGAVAGFIFFYIDYYEKTQNKTNNLMFKLLLILTIVFLSYKYYATKDSISDYKGTDFKYVEYVNKYIPSLSEHYENKIYNYYIEKGR